jgi:ubiquinone biosynthesis protein Coq4
MKRFFQAVRYTKDFARILLAIVRLILKPSDISPIYGVGSFRRHRSFQLSLETMRANPKVAALMKERYLAGPCDLVALSKLPSGTLGQVFGNRMIRENLKVEFYPPITDKEDDDVNYLRKRARQTHDIWHTACGFPTEPMGEMAISAFYLAQHRIPLSGLLIGIGFFVAVLRHPQRIDELVNTIMYAWNLGKSSDSLMAVKWEELWETPLSEVRASLHLHPQENFFENGRELSKSLEVAS